MLAGMFLVPIGVVMLWPVIVLGLFPLGVTLVGVCLLGIGVNLFDEF